MSCQPKSTSDMTVAELVAELGEARGSWTRVVARAEAGDERALQNLRAVVEELRRQREAQ